MLLYDIENLASHHARNMAFDIHTCLVMASFSLLVYDDDVIEQYEGRDNLHQTPYHINRIKIDNAEVIIADSNTCIIVAFKGTDGFADINDDINIKGVNFGRCGNVHSGFYKQYNSIRQSLYQHLDMLKMERARPVFFTGHSMGGAIASIAGRLYPDMNYKVYTFGAPRFNTAALPDLESERIYRVVNSQDIVPKFPKLSYTLSSLRYKHSGNLIFIDRHGKLHENSTFLSRLYNRVISLSTLNLRGYRDHSMTEYFHAVCKAYRLMITMIH